MHLEIIVIFKTELNFNKDRLQQIDITNKDDFKLVFPLKAYLSQPLVLYEPHIN
jgi:hypothetical protein